MTSWAQSWDILRRGCRLLDLQMVAVALVALIVEAGLRFSTLPRLTQMLGIRLVDEDERKSRSDWASPSGLPITWIRQRALAVKRVLRHSPFEDTCLRRALVLGQRIRRLDPTLVIGVRHDDSGAFAAHAWLTVAGVALDPRSDHYEVLRDRHRE